MNDNDLRRYFGEYLIFAPHGGGSHADIHKIKLKRNLNEDISISGFEYMGESLKRNQTLCSKSAISFERRLNQCLTNEADIMTLLKGNTEIVHNYGRLFTPAKEVVLINELLADDLSSLQRSILDTPLDEDVVDTYIRDICAGMSKIHEIGLHEGKVYLHRDIKPRNIFLTENGLCKIGDFSSVGENNAELGWKGHITYSDFGSEDYSAPEAIGDKGEQRQFSIQSDIYSVALVCCFISEGNIPLADSSLGVKELREAKKDNSKKSLWKQFVYESRMVDHKKEAILKALAPNPRDRFGSVKDFLTAFSPSGGPRPIDEYVSRLEKNLAIDKTNQYGSTPIDVVDRIVRDTMSLERYCQENNVQSKGVDLLINKVKERGITDESVLRDYVESNFAKGNRSLVEMQRQGKDLTEISQVYGNWKGLNFSKDPPKALKDVRGNI